MTVDFIRLAGDGPFHRLRLLAAIVFSTFLFPSSALACSCIRIAPEGFRMQADAIVEGRVTRVTRAKGTAVARVAVTRQVKGRTPRTILVRTPASSAACGYGFVVGQPQEFLLSKARGQYSTSICLMLGSRR